jgi:hypothetical protein
MVRVVHAHTGRSAARPGLGRRGAQVGLLLQRQIGAGDAERVVEADAPAACRPRKVPWH